MYKEVSHLTFDHSDLSDCEQTAKLKEQFDESEVMARKNRRHDMPRGYGDYARAKNSNRGQKTDPDTSDQQVDRHLKSY